MQVYVGEQRRSHCPLRCTQFRLRPLAVFRYSRLQPFLNQAKYPAIGHPMLNELHRPFVAQVIEEATDVGVEHPVHPLPLDAHRQRIKRLMRAASGTEPIRKALEVDLIDLVEDRHHSLLNDLVLQRCDAQRTLPPVSLRNKDSPRRFCPVRSTVHPAVQIDQSILKPGFILLPRYAVYSGRSLTLKRVEAVSERSEEHTSELQSRLHLVCRLLLEKKKKKLKAIFLI